ncbi:hypothetical protein U9M48_014035 [Paspalum notatum var. saurae]|uniref:GAG-pre-integrase domain-containing protein n=1 Tax=Paspalum notatum var. saurae TaxID=547442 RepID=A0AAQ3T1P3_PASNO
MKKTLLRGRCKGGLYPFPSSSSDARRNVFSATRPSVATWHSRLGYPAVPLVRQYSSHESVCDACQQAKSHQLPYPKSVSVSSAPLELAFSNVWGPAPTSVGRKNYYVSFIDDYSKFIWIYLLKHKSKVFQKFHEFQSLVE